MTDAKAATRATVRDRLRTITPEQRTARADALGERVTSLDVWGRTNGGLMAYLAFGDELSVASVVHAARSAGRAVAIPRTDWDHKSIEPVAYGHASVVQPGRHGVPEVVNPTPVAIEELAIVLVPGLAFTADGIRLGRGGGFYDRFLHRLTALGDARPVFVGVCFEEQVFGELPAEAHDVPMDAIISV